jgi:tRNA_anti-like
MILALKLYINSLARTNRTFERSYMKTQKNVLTLVLTLGLWVGPVLGCRTSTQKTREAVNASTISAEDLYRAYESSEADADKLYQGKILIVTGKVGATDAMPRNPSVTLIDARQKDKVQCFGFAPDQKDAMSKMEVGQRVSVKGKCMGKVVLPIPVLEDCVFQ